MLRIVQGNDFTIRVPVQQITNVSGTTKSVVDFDFTDAAVTVKLCTSYDKTAVPYSIEGNVIVIPLSSLTCNLYSIEIVIKKANTNLRSFQSYQFQIVKSNEEAELPAGTELDYNVKEVAAVTMFAVGHDGYSAYELAVKQGFVGTLDEWLASLVEPAKTAAREVTALEESVSAAESSRVRAESARVDAETARVNAEKLRVTESANAVSAANAAADNANKRAVLVYCNVDTSAGILEFDYSDTGLISLSDAGNGILEINY